MKLMLIIHKKNVSTWLHALQQLIQILLQKDVNQFVQIHRILVTLTIELVWRFAPKLLNFFLNMDTVLIHASMECSVIGRIAENV